MQGILAHEQVSTQVTLAREHISTQGTLAHEHVFGTQSTQFSRFLCIHGIKVICERKSQF